MPDCKSCGAWFAAVNKREELCPTCEKALARLADYAAPVVRCRDCAHLYGTLCTVCGLLPRKPDDFCSCGERKDGTDSDTDGSI